MMQRRRLSLLCGLAWLGRSRAEEAPPLRLVTGDLPPFAIAGQPERPGVLVELVALLLRRIGQDCRTEFYPWPRAMQLASTQARVLILPLTRTPEREANFQWLLRLYAQQFVFINRAGEPPVSSLAQARQLRLAVLRASPNPAQLLRLRFDASQVVLAASVEDMLRLLERDHVEAIYGGELVTMDKVRHSGRDPARFQVGMSVESGDIWLAAGSGFSEAERQRLLDGYAALRRDGSLERLFRAYGIRPRTEEP